MFHAAAVFVLAAGCGGDTVGPGQTTGPLTREEVAGSYNATVLMIDENGQTVDALADGAELSIALTVTGTTTGRLFVPGAAEDGGDFDVSLDGTWTYASQSQTVSFQHAADTFVRDMRFVATPGELRADQTLLTGVRIEVVLVKS